MSSNTMTDKTTPNFELENVRLRTAIRVALSMLHNPHDGGEYEDGEMPVVDVLREAINDE